MAKSEGVKQAWFAWNPLWAMYDQADNPEVFKGEQKDVDDDNNVVTFFYGEPFQQAAN